MWISYIYYIISNCIFYIVENNIRTRFINPQIPPSLVLSLLVENVTKYVLDEFQRVYRDKGVCEVLNSMRRRDNGMKIKTRLIY